MSEDRSSLPGKNSENGYLLLHPEDLEGLVGMEDAVDAIEKAYGEAATWPLVNAPRRRIHSPDGVRLGCFPGGVPELGVIGVVEHAERVVQEGPIQHTADLEHQVCVLHDSRNSKLLAVILGSVPERLVGSPARTALRTGATSGVGFRHLARENAAVCGLIGGGAQAVTQLQALKAVRPIERVNIHTRTAESRERFAATYGPLFGLEIAPVDEAPKAVAGADVVICATNTNVPVLLGEWLEPGQHVASIVGSNIALVRAGWLDEPRRELDDAAVLKADLVAVNSREQVVQDEQGDLFGLISGGEIALDDIAEIGELANGTRPGRKSDDEITLHKNNAGTGAADLAIAMVAYKQARAQGRGRWLDLAPFARQ
jgi:ornithine cyclodeaminase/alanine dehydrogenase-like protein (mu-crystallin family)